MRLLIEVHDCGSLSRAAQRLSVPLSTLSRRITELEDHVGTRFLVRTTRRIALTDAGRAYVETCRDILNRIEAAERAAAREHAMPRGALAITSPVMFGQRLLIPVVQEFLDLHSDIYVHLGLSDRNVDIVERGVDLAVRVGALPDSSLLGVKLGDTRRVVCASPATIAAWGEPHVPEDLSSRPCIAHDFQVSTTSWWFRNAGTRTERRVPITPRLSASTAEAALRAALLGGGFARLFCYQATDALRSGALRIVLADYELDPGPVSLLYAPGRTIPAKVRSFLDFAVPKLRTELAGIADLTPT